jgi:hypothetical protein
VIPELATHLARRSIMSAMALVALAVGVTHAGSHGPSTPRAPSGSSVSGTIIRANARQLVVATHGGEQVVLKLESRTVGLRDEPASTTVFRRQISTALAEGLADVPWPAPAATDLVLWASSAPLILPILGLLAIGTASVVRVISGRRLA